MTQETKQSILGELGKIQTVLGEHTSDLKAIKVQVTKTNGTVKDLQQWRYGLEKVAEDRKERQSPITTNFWDSPAFNNIIKALLVIATALAFVLGVKQ